MENINNTEISMDTYKEIESRIDSAMSEEVLIEAHKKLVDKSCKGDYREIEDCGLSFINEFLLRDWGIVYEYSKGAQEFIKSEYLSNYFKQRLEKMFIEFDKIAGVTCFYTPTMEKILNSSKTINDMNEKEIKYIYFQLKAYMADNNRYKLLIKKDYETVSSFVNLLYKLDGTGVVAYLKDDNCITKRELGVHILRTSGLTDRASYYFGRGVNYRDLNEKKLVSIFNKLFKIDVDYGINFVNMVCQMKTLGATEFINSFINFASNGFKSDGLNIEDSNISLDGLDGESRYIVAQISVIRTMNRRKVQDYESEQMKNSFIARIKPVLQSINFNYDRLDEQSFDFSSKMKI